MTEVLLSQLAHVEVFSPRPDDTVRWFTDTLGLEETTRDGRSVYLRGWGEWLHHSVQVTEGDQPGMGRAGWRTQGPDDVATIAERVESSGIRGEWFDDLAGQGRTFRFRAPGGHLQEVFWEAERYQAPPQLRTDMPDRPQKYRPRGAAVRYIDHVTIGTDGIDRDVEQLRDGYRALRRLELASEDRPAGFSDLRTLSQRLTEVRREARPDAPAYIENPLTALMALLTLRDMGQFEYDFGAVPPRVRRLEGRARDPDDVPMWRPIQRWRDGAI